MQKERLIVGQESLRALAYLNEEASKNQSSPTKKRKTGKRYIKPIAENFRRSKMGAALVQQEMKKLIEEQSKIFPDKSMQAVSGDVRYTENGKNSTIKMDRLLHVAPLWFSAYYATIRNKLHYGVQVQTALSSVPGF